MTHISIKQISLSIVLALFLASPILSQGRGGPRRTAGNQIIYGDITVEENQGTHSKPLSLDLLLYNDAGILQSRQTVPSKGRYQFINLTSGRYYIVVELENSEIARFNVDLSSPLLTDVRQDLVFQWSDLSKATKAEVVSVEDIYGRSSKTESIFAKATDALNSRRYDKAIALLLQVVEIDSADFEAWSELGRAYFIQKNYVEAEKAYRQALAQQPNYAVALISLGRLRIVEKNIDGAIEVLLQAVRVRPTLAQANFFLGEAYLQNKKGSLAVGYLNEAIRLDPVGMADAHLRLAALYNAVGMKDNAAKEYVEFLKKVPTYRDKKKLEDYISANKKP